MPARCRISTNRELLRTLTMSPTSEMVSPTTTFIADSKSLNGLLASDIRCQKTSVFVVPTNGLERAFTRMPASSKTFHPKAARREL